MRKYLFALLVLVAAGTTLLVAAFAVAGGGPLHRHDHHQGVSRNLNGYQEIAVGVVDRLRRVQREARRAREAPLVFRYQDLEGGASLFAHVHFGQRSVAGGISYFLCGGRTCRRHARTRRPHCRGRHRRRPTSSVPRPGHRARVVRGDPARHARRVRLREHPHDALGRRRDPRPDQRAPERDKG